MDITLKCTYCAQCWKAAGNTCLNSLKNSVPFLFPFWRTSLARNKNVSFLLDLAVNDNKKNTLIPRYFITLIYWHSSWGIWLFETLRFKYSLSTNTQNWNWKPEKKASLCVLTSPVHNKNILYKNAVRRMPCSLFIEKTLSSWDL